MLPSRKRPNSRLVLTVQKRRPRMLKQKLARLRKQRRQKNRRRLRR